ncbi:indole-3-glycerol phosphate synthase TrpC [Bacillus dakarensis]|uniref:indole-3-glycerol phosphate synthase TrpC n=1 Tax=Robertmurraya dakarensis TaxID=1926278 RepID=UPI000981437A|nr:indole-3-glycerol phosphate synthase TrpC [Bacillus dakarensis]
MGTILDKIIAEKVKEVERLKGMELVDGHNRSEKRSFISILEKAKDVSIIAEFKRASPSKGDINPGIDPKIQTRTYVESGADAVSVLTDTPFFKGSLEDLKAVRSSIGAPILCKDFIIDPIQIDCAKNAGADIILLIAAALSDVQLHDFYQYALERDLEVLMEVHNEEEAERVLKTGNHLIGVNNRDLKTFEVDLAVTESLAPMIKKEGHFLISESGMVTPEDVARVVKAGANGILVGETFMRHVDPAAALKEMKLPLIEVSYK